MVQNEGSIDRAVRLGIGLVLLVTGLVGFCPLYRLFGIRTGPAAT
jgi:hypothetical protein